VALVLIGAASVLTDAQAADPSKGRALYMQHCQNCHGSNGVGQLPGMPDFSHGEGLLKPDLEVARVIKAGSGMMPSYQGIFTDNEILDLVAFLRTFR
jgi:mono/diheme cytochrome c family protein